MKKMLIVDDNAQNLYMLQILLETNGYDVFQASNGKEALELAQNDPPDMIISDILMPVMDGFSLCHTWKNDERLKKIPFVFYTATYIDPKDEAFALSLGADRFIVKPITPDELLIALKDIIEACETGDNYIPKTIAKKEDEYYKEYSETLIRKLEDKMIQLEQANKRLASLYQASCDLTTIKISTDLIHRILHAIVENAAYQRVNYYHYDNEQGKLFLLDSVGFDDHSLKAFKEKAIFNLGEEQGLVGLAAQKLESVNIMDTARDPRWIAFDPQIHSALYVPVHYKSNILGVFVLYSGDKKAFTEVDERNVGALANSLAVSMENRKVREEILQLNAKLEQRVAERTAQLESSNRELEAFAYSVSHDLRAPLRVIGGYARILSEDYRSCMDEEGNQLLSSICSNTDRMGKLISDLLALSKVSRSELRLSRLNMAALIKTVFDEAVTPEEQKRCKLTIHPLSDAFGDSTLICQVWSNLLMNAVKYSQPKQESIVTITSHVEGDMTVYSIHDNGVGFNPKYADRLFGLFQRLHDSEEFDGTGIGLAIVKRIVERHGGQVWAEGEINEGATFSFSIPTGKM